MSIFPYLKSCSIWTHIERLGIESKRFASGCSPPCQNLDSDNSGAFSLSFPSFFHLLLILILILFLNPRAWSLVCFTGCFSVSLTFMTISHGTYSSASKNPRFHPFSPVLMLLLFQLAGGWRLRLWWFVPLRQQCHAGGGHPDAGRRTHRGHVPVSFAQSAEIRARWRSCRRRRRWRRRWRQRRPQELRALAHF